MNIYWDQSFIGGEGKRQNVWMNLNEPILVHHFKKHLDFLVPNEEKHFHMNVL